MKSSAPKKRKDFTSGFTLIETFVAITILLIAMTGPMVLITKGVAVAKSVKGKITAIYLAQEAVEYIRNARDENTLSGNNWLAGLGGCLSPYECKIDSPAQTVASCGGDCPVLKYDNATKLYGYASGTNSIFKREIQINEIVAGKEVKITVDLFWNEGPRNKQFTVTEHLLKWQE